MVNVTFSQSKLTDSYLCIWIALLHSVSYIFFLFWLPSFSLCIVFDAVSSNIDDVFSFNSSAHVSVFGDFKVYDKDGQHILMKLIDMMNSDLVFLSQMTIQYG